MDPNALKLPLLLTFPPYRDFSMVRSADEVPPTRCPPGTLAAISVRCTMEERDAVRETTARARRAWPHLPVIVRIAGGHESDIAHMARYVGSIGARAVLLPDEPIHPTLVRILPHPIDLGRDVAEWLEQSGCRLGPVLPGVIRLLVNGGPAHCTVGQVLREALLPESHVRIRFRRAGLPPPVFWFSLGRVIAAVHPLQACPDVPLLYVAFDVGYREEGSLSRRMHQLASIRPSAIRGTLGWEWIAARAMSAAVPTAWQKRRIPVSFCQGPRL